VVLQRHSWIIAGLAFVVILIPVWIGPYPPLYDYLSHLLEAHVAAHYHDPQFGYAARYELRDGWYLRSNALSTLLLIWLARILPIAIAGQLVLSLYLALVVSGLGLLLRRSGTAWPLLLLAPLYAYNYTFILGWLNFSFGMGLGLHAIAWYMRWEEHQSRVALLVLALLFLFIYMAHLAAWALVVLTVAAVAGTSFQWRRHGLLLLTLNTAFPLLLLTRPMLAVGGALIAPAVWCLFAMLRRLRLQRRTLVAVVVITAVASAGLIQVLEPARKAAFPEVVYWQRYKLLVPFNIFALPDQFMTPDRLITAYNLVVALLTCLLGGLLVLGLLQRRGLERERWLAALALLSLVYVAIPNRTADIAVLEPRVLLLIVYILVFGTQLPVRGWQQRAVTVLAVSVCLLSVGGTVRYAYLYNQRAVMLESQLRYITLGRDILVLRGDPATQTRDRDLLTLFKTDRTGEHFSVIHQLEYGGFTSVLFDNGPVRPDRRFPIPLYYWSEFSNGQFVKDRCAEIAEMYDTVLVWGTPPADLTAQLNACIGRGVRLTDMAIWSTR
jgi:hypothetical protein